MVSTSTTFALTKRRLSRKSVSTRRNEAFDKNPFPLAGKTASDIGIEKIEENLLTPNFKHCVHQLKKLRIKAQSL